MNKRHTIKNLDDLQKLAKLIYGLLLPGTIVLLHGDLGSGKTAFVKKLLHTAGIEEKKVKSPTFSLINAYKTDNFDFYHLDLYRLTSHDRFLLEEIKEMMEGAKTVVMIEWPENMDLHELEVVSAQTIKIDIDFSNKNFRIFRVCVN